MSDIDWKTELRKIEREYDGLPPEPTPEIARAQGETLRHVADQTVRRSASLAASARVFLVTALLAGLHWWPYHRDCGLPLAGFVAAQVMVAVGGLWTAAYAWKYRLASHHVLALVLMLTGAALVSAQVLPRQGYVTIRGFDATGWRCGAR